jgi:hypothetical protein
LDGVIIIFAFLEIINACQSFILQVRLSAGIDDTPADLVMKTLFSFLTSFLGDLESKDSFSWWIH